MQTVITINAVIMALFFVCYSYQFFYVAVALRPPVITPSHPCS